jgi:hypothetical protein
VISAIKDLETRGTDVLKINKDELERLEDMYPAITERIMRFENALLPVCRYCESKDTAEVNVGTTGRSMAIARATSKFTFVPNGPRPGVYRCNWCSRYFD